MHQASVENNQVFVEINSNIIAIDNYQVLVNGQIADLPVKREEYEIKRITVEFKSSLF